MQSPLTPTDSATLPELFTRAKAAQASWSLRSPKERARVMLAIREVLIQEADRLAALLSEENGKPLVEALTHEIVPSVDALTTYSKRAPKLLAPEAIPLTLMKHRFSRLEYWPLGVVAVIGPWNFPFYIPLADIVLALLAGNAVVFKPSEFTPRIALEMKALFERGGLPGDLLQVVVGDGALGEAVINQRPAKVFFTGSAATGRKVMASAAKHLIPVNLELGGKNALIVLADADLDFASSAALWGGLCNSGQICAGISRILVHESIADVFESKYVLKMKALRPGVDLGRTTVPKQSDVYAAHLDDARSKGIQLLTGGQFSEDRSRVEPTLLKGDHLPSARLYNEETFGPIQSIRTFRSLDEAITLANDSAYGLVASVITRNLSLGEHVASRLEVGTVMINEVLYTAGLAETPWGGVKESGFGRTHADIGFKEFSNVRHVHGPRSRLFVSKSLWWFPYSPLQYALFRSMLELYRAGVTDKIRAIPAFLWNLVNFLKGEPRL